MVVVLLVVAMVVVVLAVIMMIVVVVIVMTGLKGPIACSDLQWYMLTKVHIRVSFQHIYAYLVYGVFDHICKDISVLDG